MRKFVRYSWAIGVSIFVAFAAGAEEPKAPERMGPRPVWEKGVWWVTETHVMHSVSTDASAPMVFGDILYLHRWIVAGEEVVNGDACWTVEIRPCGLPQSEKSNVGDSFQAKLWLNKTTFVMRRLECYKGLGRYCTTAPVQHRVDDYVKGFPVTVVSAQFFIGCPLDMPMLPSQWYVGGLDEKSKVTTYESEVFHETATQTIEPWVRVDGEELEEHPESWKPRIGHAAMFVTLTTYQDMRTQLWVPECPWWIEWRSIKKDGRMNYIMWYSRTIDWSGKKNDFTLAVPAQALPHEEKSSTETTPPK